MNAPRRAGRLAVGLTLLVVLAGCATGASLTQPHESSTRASAPSTVVATPAPTIPENPSPTAQAIVVTSDVAYERTNPALVPGTLDVYAPAKAGARPVVVMFHGAPGSDPKTDRSYLGEHARKLVDLGFVVFNASWGHSPSGSSDAPTYDGLVATASQAACAVEFARAHAAEYGGDPSTMIVFGHSGGAHAGAMATFVRPEPTAGCLGGSELGAIDALVTWEGNWLLSVNYPDWDGALAADPRIRDIVTPWSYLADHQDQKVVMLVSENPGDAFEREVGDPWTGDSWLAVRDPSGDLRRLLEKDGAFADGTLDFVEVQQLLYSVLEAQGNPVSLDVMPDSVHDHLGTAGWPVFLAAFQKAAVKG